MARVPSGADAMGEAEGAARPPLGPSGGDEGAPGVRPPPQSRAPPGPPGSEAQAEPSPPAGLREAPPPAGAAPDQDPPPYSPPDPKSIHLLYPAFQANCPVFYQPGPLQPNTLPGASPFTIYDRELFGKIPPEADRRGYPPKDYLVESVLVMTFCCCLTGAAALVHSHETRVALNRGNLAQAKAASQKARSLVLTSLIVGVLFSVSWVVYVLVTLYL